jgi:hypothetical protein
MLLFALTTNLTHFLMCLFHFSTCFEQPSAHHQENQLYQYIIWYISLCVGDRLLCRSPKHVEKWNKHIKKRASSWLLTWRCLLLRPAILPSLGSSPDWRWSQSDLPVGPRPILQPLGNRSWHRIKFLLVEDGYSRMPLAGDVRPAHESLFSSKQSSLLKPHIDLHNVANHVTSVVQSAGVSLC